RKKPLCEDCPLNQWGPQDNMNDMRWVKESRS
ncbi:MAG: hypothetical protein JRF52_06070, partial [Deltaproteobacteria bacterium]|nr:hypothetical protein [Deltaproteobacteria bacterium]